jgi:hypothetical protein
MTHPSWIFWRVTLVDDSGDEDVVVATYPKVIVRLGSDAKWVELVNEDQDQRVKLIEDSEVPDLHAVIGYQGVEILNCYTDDGRYVTLRLAPYCHPEEGEGSS